MVFADLALLEQFVDYIDVESRRGFQVDVILNHLVQHKREMRAFRTVTIIIGTLVIRLCYCHVEQSFRLLDLGTYLGEVGNLQRRSVLLDDVHERYIMESQFVFFHIELLLREFECLLYQIDILVLHFPESG